MNRHDGLHGLPSHQERERTGWLSANPFTTDPKMQMIAFLAEEANISGQPLTDWERRILAAENPDVDEKTERRLKTLVEAVVARQKRSGLESDSHSFMNALPWAGDREYPYVVALAETEAAGAARTIGHVIRRAMPPPFATFGVAIVIAAAILLLYLSLKQH
jgi:hypothetical protein